MRKGWDRSACLRDGGVTVAKPAGEGVQRTVGGEARGATGAGHQGLQPMSSAGVSAQRGGSDRFQVRCCHNQFKS